MIHNPFPSPTLARYVGKMFLVRTVAVLLLLVVVLQALDFLSEAGRVLAVAGNGQSELLHYIMLRLPQIVAFILPFSVLLGTLITLTQLNSNSEVVSMKAGGLSPHQILAPLVLTALAIAVFAFLFNETIAAPATDALSRWQKVDYAAVPAESGVRTNVWVRSGPNLIHVGRVSGKGKAVRLSDVTVYERPSGALDTIVHAAGAAPVATGGWAAVDASRFDVRTARETQLGTLVTGKGVSPEQFTLQKVDGDRLSIFELGRAITDLRAAGRPVAELQAAWWHKFSGPLSAVLMPLLGAVAAFGLARSGKLFVRAVFGMGFGFLYFVVDNMAMALGNMGAYPPALAAWGPFALFLVVGELVLLRTEE